MRQSTYGTTAKLTTRIILAVLGLTVLGLSCIAVLAWRGVDPAFASAAGMVVAAGLGALGVGGGAGTYGHSAQYHRYGSPTGMPPGVLGSLREGDV